MHSTSHLGSLVSLFYQEIDLLGKIDLLNAEEMPPVYQRLLAHCNHMTVTVEAFHHSLVDVEVLESHWKSPIYLRKILLRRQSDRQVVQFGLVRLDTSVLPVAAREEILSGLKPLGRVLIEHEILREVHLSRLFRIACGPELAHHFSTSPGTITYGRTARIHFSDHPALNLLEVVAPVPDGLE